MWYVLLNDEQFGPMQAHELKSMFEQGVIDGESLIWREGLDEWITINDSELTGWHLDSQGSPASAAPYESDESDESEEHTLIAHQDDEGLQAALADLYGESLEVPVSKSSVTGPTSANEEDELPVPSPVDAASTLQSDGPPAEGQYEPATIAMPVFPVDDADIDSGEALDDLLAQLSSAEIASGPEPVALSGGEEVKPSVDGPQAVEKSELEPNSADVAPDIEFSGSYDLADLLDRAESKPEVHSEAAPIGERRTRVQESSDVAGLSPLPAVIAAADQKPIISDVRLPRKKSAFGTLIRWVLIAVALLGTGGTYWYTQLRTVAPAQPKLAAAVSIGVPTHFKSTQPREPRVVDAMVAAPDVNGTTDRTDATVVALPDGVVSAAGGQGPDGGTTVTNDAQVRQVQAKVAKAAPSGADKASGQPAAAVKSTGVPTPPQKEVEAKKNGPQPKRVAKAKKRRVRKAKKIRSVARTRTKRSKTQSVKKRKKTTKAQVRKRVRAKGKTATKPASRRKSTLFGNPSSKKRDLPFSLGHKQIIKVFKKSTKSLVPCIKLQPELKGRLVSVSLTIRRDGKASRVRAVSLSVRGRPAGQCIEKAVSRLTFPQFRGDNMRVTIPVRL